MTERTRSRVQAAEMGLLRKVAGLSLRDRVRSSVIREEPASWEKTSDWEDLPGLDPALAGETSRSFRTTKSIPE
ncbi:hypothetical protein DPEC_G00106820 [Dallia pectoralis]|uniref:Uncharacterized protein n=1 Tax=Dallia pectoralis TaxID=75939 RepID=A0ACC2GYL6_DALPE|nr:hypothetical protein DPEC_G00106820 [Dallia pectoralis]